MAKPIDQFSARDVTFWGVFALAAWGVAMVGAAVSGLIPEDFLSGLHASRQGSASVAELRSRVAELETQSADLRAADGTLQQRFVLTENATGDLKQRIGALEVSVPKLVEAVNTQGSVDKGSLTASIHARTVPVTTFTTDGGSVSYTRTPLDGGAAPTTQPMPAPLPADAEPAGIALGPPVGDDDGETAWQNLNSKVGALLLGLTPVLGHIEGGPGRRLVAGPFPDDASAQELCGRMAKVGIACAVVPYMGEALD